MAEYQGKKVVLNKPRRISKGSPGHGKKTREVFVMSDGKVKRVTFGDPNLGAHPGDKKRKASYCARSKSLGSDRTKANYWSRKQWKC
jgi:hypothetical protein|tara:strand:- start:420 stop:680 length:261 start_codon:yes stop_codon:yes gene_type:complete